jgi:hypothetical protein
MVLYSVLNFFHIVADRVVSDRADGDPLYHRIGVK